MSFFVWNSSYEIGIEQIDEQHKVLVNIISTLFDAMRVGLGYKQVQETIVKLRDYTITHFSDEEKLMKEINFPNYIGHIEAHKYFIETVEDFTNRFENGEMALSLIILEFLKNWLTNHILTADKEISEFKYNLR